MIMTRMARTTLYVGGIALSLGSLAILLLGLAFAVFLLAWSNHSPRELLLIAIILLYPVPAGIALLYGATWAISSANAGDFEPTTASSRRTIGALLLLPFVSTAVMLVVGFPEYQFWPFSEAAGVVTVLLALVMAGSGAWLISQSRARVTL